jgi:hypothetical protein
MQADRPQTLPAERVNGGQNASEHAQWIAGRVQVLLGHYYQPDVPQEVREAAIDDWIDALSVFSRETIERACSRYIKSHGSRRPTPGDIRNNALRIDRDSTPRALPPPEPEREKVSPEVAARIIEDAGFTPDLSNALKRFPQSLSKQQAVEMAAEPERKQMGFETNAERLRKAREKARVI